MGGHLHHAVEKQHRIHGKVFRVSPNELSFASVKSWKGIYGPWPGQRPFIKSEFYSVFGGGFASTCIGSERDPVRHGRMKRFLAPAFAPRALAEQEAVVRGCVDAFVAKLGPLSSVTPRGLDMTAWFEMVAFDVLGEMAFGESFGCVASEQPHSWQQMIAKHLFFITVVDNLRRYPLLHRLGSVLLPRLTVEVRNKHTGFCRDKISRRLASSLTRKDFLTELTKQVKLGEVSKEELTAHASTLVVAGGETVAAFLAATTYYLCQSPDAMMRLQSEIRTHFSSYDAINSTQALQLPYLQAVISEGLRIFPPASQGMPRTSPGACVDDVWVPPGVELYTSTWTVTHDEANFADPRAFRPERWLDRDTNDNREASQPFLVGPRGCIGRNFAYMEMSLILAKTVFMYDIELVDKAMDWERQCHLHVQWWKPELRVRYKTRTGSVL